MPPCVWGYHRNCLEFVGQPCVRGCHEPCKCSICVGRDSAVHAPVPSLTRVGTGRLCARCSGRLRSLIGEVQTRLGDLSLDLESKPKKFGRRPPGKPTSPALIRIDVLALWSHQSNADVREIRGRYVIDSTDVRGVLTAWGENLAKDSGLSDMWSGAWVLEDNFDLLVQMPWVGECLDELTELAALLARTEGEESQHVIGRCTSRWFVAHPATDTEPAGLVVGACGAALYLPPSGSKAPARFRCQRCGQVYDGMKLLELDMKGWT